MRFFFDYVYHNENATEFVAKLEKSREKMERIERKKVEGRSNATKTKQLPQQNKSNEGDEDEDNVDQCLDEIIDRLTHRKEADDIFEDVQEDITLTTEEKEAVYVRALQRAGIWVARNKKDPVDKLLHTQTMMPRKENVEHAFTHWLEKEQKRRKNKWIE